MRFASALVSPVADVVDGPRRNPARTDNKQALASHLVLQLIMEHLSFENYHRTIQAIQDESNVPRICPLLRSPLPSLLSPSLSSRRGANTA